MKKIFTIGSVILILLFLAVCFIRPEFNGLKIIRDAATRQKTTDRLRHQIEEQEARYNADCEKLLAAFVADLERNVSPDFDKASRAVPKVVDDLCGFKVCVKLCYKAAKDKIQGTHEFPDAYMAVMDAPIVQPCVHANAVASDMLQNLQQRLRERHAQYAADLAAVCRNENINGNLPAKDLENLQNCLETFAGKTFQAQLNKIMAGVGVVFEVIFIRESSRLIIKLLAKPVARICSSLGIGAICAVADGPLPIGDAIGVVFAVGGLAWTAWDVYDVMCRVPKNLNAELRNGIETTKAKLLGESRAQALNMVRAYQQAGSKTGQELRGQLK